MEPFLPANKRSKTKGPVDVARQEFVSYTAPPFLTIQWKHREIATSILRKLVLFSIKTCENVIFHNMIFITAHLYTVWLRVWRPAAQ